MAQEAPRQPGAGSRVSSAGAWLRASRPASQSYIALPLILGQLLAPRPLDPLTFVLVQLFGVFDQLYIVWANDVADVEADRNNQTPTIFSGGSRVLVEGTIPRASLRNAALFAAAMVLILGVVSSVRAATPWPFALSTAALLLLWAYSYPPIRLSYRGGGELLQMIGVGLVLPLFGYASQAGGLAGYPWRVELALLPTCLACAMATSLPDAPGDRASGKHTSAVLLGPLGAVVVIALLDAASVIAVGRYHAVFGVLLVAIVAIHPAPPGSRRIVARVFLAVLVTLSVMGVLIAEHA